VDGLVRVAEHEVGGVLELAAHPAFALRILLADLPRLKRDELARERCVGGGLEDDRHLAAARLHRRRRHRDAGRQLAAVEHEVAVEVLPGGVDQHGVAVAPRHEDGLPRLRVAVDPRDRQRQLALRRQDLHAVDEVGLPAAEMILHGEDVLAVLRRIERERRVEPLGVVVRGDALAVGPRDAHDGIEPRPQLPGEALDHQRLSLLGAEAEAIDVAGLLDHAVEREPEVARRGGGGVVVRLLLQRVADLRDTKRQRRRADAAGPVAVGREELHRVARGGHVDLALDRPGSVAEERHLHLLARLAAGRIDRGRPGKRADVQPIP
jgi:hypothetical protein